MTELQDKEKYYKDYREALLRECQWLYSALFLYRRITERTNDRLKEINIAPHFFHTVLHALFSSIVVSCHKLFDPQGERGFYDYLRFVQENIESFSLAALKRRRNYKDNDSWFLRQKEITHEIIKNDRKRISHMAFLKSIEILRHNLHAHLDKEYFIDRAKLDEEAPLTWEDFTEISKLMNEMLNKYSIAFDGTEYSLEFRDIDDVDRLLNKLHAARQADIKMMENLTSPEIEP